MQAMRHGSQQRQWHRRALWAATVGVLTTAAALPLALQAQVADSNSTPVLQTGAPPETPAQQLADKADLFMHYSLMGDQKLAGDFGQAILNAGPTPVQALRAFESAANGRNIGEILLRNEQNHALRAVSLKIAKLLDKGHIILARNPDRIRAAIAHMGDSPRAYVVSRHRLAAAGEFAMPFFIEDLNNPSDSALYPTIIQMMNNLGKPLLNPMVQAINTPNETQRIQLINVLGNIGYRQALPYLKQIAEKAGRDAQLRSAAEMAMAKIAGPSEIKMPASKLFVQLAWEYFNNTPSVSANHPAEATNPVWYYDSGLHNVVGVPVPTAIWADVMTMRACEAALQLDHTNARAISLWLAADLRREVDLPAGASDPTHPAGTPDAHYYAVAAGPIYLNPVLQIALSQHNSPLILKTIAALQATGGVAGLVGKGKGQTPLMAALAYPDTQVRFAAASALAMANPEMRFDGAYRVAPVLGEAVAQTAKPAAILVDPNPQNRNRIKAFLRDHYTVYDAAHLSSAVALARRAPYIGLIVVPGGMSADHLIQLASTDFRLAYAPVLVTGDAVDLSKLALRYVGQVEYAPVAKTGSAGDFDAALGKIMNRLGISPISSDQAKAFSLEACSLLKSIAVNRGSIYDINTAIPALVQGLGNSDASVVIASAGVLGQVRNPQAQLALAKAALMDASAPTATREALFLSLAASARNVGDHLSSGSIDRLIHVAADEQDLAVRSAAATALGALNVPSNQASELIRSQIH